MAGDIFLKEGVLFTLEASGSSLTQGTGVATTTNLDARASGSAGVVQNIELIFEIVCQWTTVTGIVAGGPICELYLVPAVDGSNFSDVDLTSGSSFIAFPAYLTTFVCGKAPLANTNIRAHTGFMRLRPLLYKPYILNRSGQTISSTWALKVMTCRYQYT